jgi:hypothetical protein
MIGQITGSYKESNIIPIKIGNNIYDVKKKLNNNTNKVMSMKNNKNNKKIKSIKKETIFPEIKKEDIEKMVNTLLNKHNIPKITPQVILDEKKEYNKILNQIDKPDYLKKKNSNSNFLVLDKKIAILIDTEYKKQKSLMNYKITTDEFNKIMKEIKEKEIKEKEIKEKEIKEKEIKEKELKEPKKKEFKEAKEKDLKELKDKKDKKSKDKKKRK